ncbi:MAG: hypothetical protein NT099_01845 [Candidatus Saganbacteria bacterium]|nr:hypothetical protein [Candidatus Saganbacteria bacterium]
METKLSLFLLASILLSGICFATPSTQIWNPSTDIQTTGTYHFGIDNYATLVPPSDGGYAFPTDFGLTYGALPGLEVGIDLFAPQENPAYFNLKYGIPEAEKLPAFAVGGYNFGTKTEVTDQNIVYGLIAKTFPLGRLSAGYFSGNPNLLVDNNGNKDNAGLILTWDKYINDKLWLCIDYAGTKSVIGSTFYGLSWAFSSNTSVLFAYGTWNNGAKPTVTTQLDINF